MVDGSRIRRIFWGNCGNEYHNGNFKNSKKKFNFCKKWIMVSTFVVYGNTYRNIFAIAKHTPIICVINIVFLQKMGNNNIFCSEKSISDIDPPIIFSINGYSWHQI